MKKVTAFIVILSVLFAAFAIMTSAAETVEFARITASGNDPYATFTFHDGKSIDPDTVKWASVRYRTITEVDNTGVQLKGQLYVNPAAEPFIPIVYKHTQKWETAIVDLTSVSSKTTLSSIWDSSHYSGKTAIRFDPMEPDRDAEDQQNLTNIAEVEPDSSIDIAWVAFFENKADAEAYDGTQNTPACILLPEDLTSGQGGNNIGNVEILTEEAKAEDPSQSGGDQPGETPATTDASVIAIAAVACIALAGVVIAKKVR